MKRALSLAVLFVAAACAGAQSGTSRSVTLKVLTLNIRNDAGDRLPGIVDLIKRSGADVVGLQEVDASGPEIAKRLGFRYARFDSDTAVVSRYEIAPGPGPSAVKVLPPGGAAVTFVDVHLFHKPYQPYQLLGIPYEDGRFIHTEAEAIAEARAARIDQVESTVAALAKDDGPIVLVGDFNEPSYLDWTERTASAKRHPIPVAWPATKTFADAGFSDSFRTLFPDEMAKPGFTWTPGLDPADPKDHADRIDFVLFRGTRIKPESAWVVGEDSRYADLVIAPYPTDHRGVLVLFDVGADRFIGS